jgi:hypothetical protein
MAWGWSGQELLTLLLAAAPNVLQMLTGAPYLMHNTAAWFKFCAKVELQPAVRVPHLSLHHVPEGGHELRIVEVGDDTLALLKQAHVLEAARVLLEDEGLHDTMRDLYENWPLPHWEALHVEAFASSTSSKNSEKVLTTPCMLKLLASLLIQVLTSLGVFGCKTQCKTMLLTSPLYTVAVLAAAL